MKVHLLPRPGFGWGKAERLRKHSQFCRVQNKGRRLGGKFISMIFTPSSILYPRFGITVSKRVGNAVVRNKLKRRLRDILRHQKQNLPANFDFVLIAKPGAGQAHFADISSEVNYLFGRVLNQLSRKIAETKSPDTKSL